MSKISKKMLSFDREKSKELLDEALKHSRRIKNPYLVMEVLP
jgi:hypothetical protein